MPTVDLAPLAKTDVSFRSFLETQFRRIADTLDIIPEFEQGTVTVTGGVEIQTGLINVLQVVASLVDIPVAGACFVRAVPVNIAENRGTDYGNILIDVYNSSFALSTIPINVGWIAIGSTKVT